MRGREASRLATEHITLLESIGDPILTVGLSFAALAAKHSTGEMAEVLRLAQRVIDLARGDPTMSNLIFGSPLAFAITFRGAARWRLGISGWKDDFAQAVAMARAVDPMTLGSATQYSYHATQQARAALEDMFDYAAVWSALGIAVFVETLLDRCGDGDREDGQAAIDRLVALPTDPELVLNEITLLRLTVLLARVHGDETPTATIGIATARWRHHLGSRGI
jgi:hypothetical protein